MSASDNRLNFFYGQDAVGAFTSTDYPTVPGLYGYMPARSAAHYQMGLALKACERPKCWYRRDGCLVKFTVARSPSQGSLELTDFAMETEPLPVLAVVRDLMFSSRITQAARHAQAELKIVRDPAKLADLDGRLLIADLNQEGALAAAAAWRGRTGRVVIGYVQHVDAEKIRAARAAGIDEVMPRSQFVLKLPELLVKD